MIITKSISLFVTLLAIVVVSDAQPLAFPGAEGFGKYTTGGRGGKVFIVTNLEDAGPGSFREAAEAKMPRTIVFAVSGTIHLKSRLPISKNVTIAGQTAPGDGVCLADYPVTLSGDNIIMRYIRIRMGDRYQSQEGQVDGSGADDALSGSRKKNIIIDHCSLSWSTDEVCSIYAGDSTTLQYNIISEPLNYSYHFEEGDKDFENHGYGGIWGGRHFSAYFNLIAHCVSRTPRFDGIRNAPEENVDFRNNVIYNWGHNNIYAAEGGNYNMVNNYYKAGPSTNKNVKAQIVNPYDLPGKISYGKFYLAGNYMDGAPQVTQNNWKGVRMGGKNAPDPETVKMESPFPAIPMNMLTPEKAYEKVLNEAGAVMPARDTLDMRVINDVRSGTGGIIDVQGGFPHGTPYEQTVKAWPFLKQTTAPKDTDKDGMPDFWEKQCKLDPNDPADGNATTLQDDYTNLEVYLHSLTVPAKGKKNKRK